MLLLLVFTFVFLLCNNKLKKESSNSLSVDRNAITWNGEQPLIQDSESIPAIAIPGFDSLVFKSNQKSQKVNFYNPKDNHCLFLMGLYINDKLYWQSGYVQPGDGYYDIKLEDVLRSGEYNAYLKIQCYKPDGFALNSAKVNFNLTVK